MECICSLLNHPIFLQSLYTLGDLCLASFVYSNLSIQLKGRGNVGVHWVCMYLVGCGRILIKI